MLNLDWERFERRTMIALGAFFFLLCAFTVASALGATDAFGVIFIMMKAMLFGLFAGLCWAGLLGEHFGKKMGGLLYPLRFLKKESPRIAAAEALSAKHDYEGAEKALQAVLKEEPQNVFAAIAMAKTQLAWKGEEGWPDASAILLKTLESMKEVEPGASAAALLLADILQEHGLAKKAEETLRAELLKNYCRAEGKLLRNRLDFLASRKDA